MRKLILERYLIECKLVEEIVITRRGQAVARVIPEGIERAEDRKNLVASIRASRAAIIDGKGSLSARELINEGRRF